MQTEKTLPPRHTPNKAGEMPIMVGENLSKHYPVSTGLFKPKGLVRSLDGISFELYRGKTLAVVGESGCGKSTLARLITMIEAPTAGTLWMDGKKVHHADKTNHKAFREKVQMVFQNPFGSLNPRKKIGQAIEEPLIINTTLTKAERHERVMTMMEKVGLRPEFHRRYPHMFSGGQRQRVAIARALILNPEVVVADEPVSALDVSIQAQVLNLLMDLQDSLGVAYIFISHNLAVVELIAENIMVIYLGKVVEIGDKKTIMANPLHPYTQALLASTPRIHASERRERVPLIGELPSPLSPPSGCAFNPRCPKATAQCKMERPTLQTVEGRQVACFAVA